MPKHSQDIPENFAEYERTLARAIGERIRQRRVYLQLRQENIRTKMELEGVYISRTQFSRIESGQSLPKASEIIALAAVLRISYSWLLLGHKEDIQG